MNVKKIGAFIALNRKLKGLTQEQLGEKLGVSNKTVSRWENGNYMPDLSLLEPLSNELGITLNELLAGEKIEKEDISEYTEKNLISTIGYTSKTINNERKKISLLIISTGLILVLYTFVVCEADYNWISICSILGISLIIIGTLREVKFDNLLKKILAFIFTLFFMLAVLHIIDYICVISAKRPPVYRYMVETVKTDTDITVYHSLLYNVYRINARTPNEYYIIDNKKEYSLNTVPVSPFNREISGIDNIEKYKNDFVGNNSNIGILISNLPLSEYGYVFKIDFQNVGLVIDYHFTDWYANENLYVEKSLIYNSVSIFTLIDNINYIQYNFSGSSYKVTRKNLMENYPNYEELFVGKKISKKNFNKYVEKKMNDITFVQSLFNIFKS